MNHWEKMYRQKLTTPDEAVNLIDNGEIMLVGLLNGVPPGLVSAVARKAKRGELRDSTFREALQINSPDILSPDVLDKIHYECGYAALARAACATGIINYDLMRLSTAKRQTDETTDVLLMRVSPMDKHGFFSTGFNPDYSYGLSRTERSRKILIEVNNAIPRTYGYNHVHISEVDAIVENNIPLICLPDIPLTKEDEAIGNYIAEEIPDGACIQLGIGGIPNAVGKALENKKDLGVHSEMICDSMMDLYHKGVITSKKKNFMPDKWIATFAFGSQALYDFVGENPLIEFYPADFVNDPRIASRNDNLMSVNSTLEVDLSGQCSSETIAYHQYSGIGGQHDFVSAAWFSRGGKTFIATHSTYTDKDGNLCSKIVPTLTSFTSLNRYETHYIVTENGIANIRDIGMHDRVKEMVRLAHPDFRDWLRFEAKRLNFII